MTVWVISLIASLIGAVVIYDRICIKYESYKAQQKTASSKPITAIDFTYSQEVLAKRIEQQAEELRRITEGREEG